MCASLLRFVAADDGRETSTKVDRRWRKKERLKERLKERERGFPLSRLSLSLPSKEEKKLGKKKVIKKKTHLRTVSSEQHASCWYSRQTFTSDGMYVGVDTCCVLFVAHE
jgi:hypothetical protein